MDHQISKYFNALLSTGFTQLSNVRIWSKSISVTYCCIHSMDLRSLCSCVTSFIQTFYRSADLSTGISIYRYSKGLYEKKL